MVAECPIELQRVTFVDVTSPSDRPTMHTRAALRSTTSTATNKATTNTSTEQNPARHESSGKVSTNIHVTTDEPHSSALPRKSNRLSQPPER